MVREEKESDARLESGQESRKRKRKLNNRKKIKKKKEKVMSANFLLGLFGRAPND